MRRLLILLSFLVLSVVVVAGCGNDGADRVNTPGNPQTGQPAEQPSPTPAEQPTEPQRSPQDIPTQTMTPQECELAGGTFRPSLGGAIECEPGESKIAQVAFGIEGGVCCR
jgi:hypothetical protein